MLSDLISLNRWKTVGQRRCEQRIERVVRTYLHCHAHKVYLTTGLIDAGILRLSSEQEMLEAMQRIEREIGYPPCPIPHEQLTRLGIHRFFAAAAAFPREITYSGETFINEEAVLRQLELTPHTASKHGLFSPKLLTTISTLVKVAAILPWVCFGAYALSTCVSFFGWNIHGISQSQQWSPWKWFITFAFALVRGFVKYGNVSLLLVFVARKLDLEAQHRLERDFSSSGPGA